MLDRIAAAGVDLDLVLPVLSVRESYLDAAYEQVSSQFGSIENYFTVGLGLDGDVMDGLRDRLIG